MLPRIIEVAKCLIPVDEVLTLQEKKNSLLYCDSDILPGFISV